MVVDYRFFDSPEWKALDKAGKLLLLYFAVKADRKNGFSCNPSLRQISEQTGYGERTLLETLSHLVKTGLIRREKSAGGSIMNGPSPLLATRRKYR